MNQQRWPPPLLQVLQCTDEETYYHVLHAFCNANMSDLDQENQPARLV